MTTVVQHAETEAVLPRGLGLTEIIDGQLSLFAIPGPSTDFDHAKAAVDWLASSFQRRISGGLDNFPFTADFDRLFEVFTIEHGQAFPFLEEQTGAESRMAALWLTLLRLRKAGRLGSAGRRNDSTPLTITRDEIEICRTQIGLPLTRSERERLPYTAQFRELLKQYQRQARHRNVDVVTEHRFWRMIVRIMKSERVDEGSSLFDAQQ